MVLCAANFQSILGMKALPELCLDNRIILHTKYIQLKGVHKAYGTADAAQAVLRDVSFDVERGERVAVLGHSGCGKSTLLNVISGIDSIDSGDITVAGISLTNLSETDRTLFRRKNIGFVYQSFNLIQTLTAIENIRLPLQLNQYSPADTEQLAHDMLERVGLAARADAFPDQLSGGEQQRIAIARAMVHSPALVLADEHTGNLDADTGQQMMALFNELARSAGQTVFMVTHSLAVAKTADRVLQFSQGRLHTGDPLDDSTVAW